MQITQRHNDALNNLLIKINATEAPVHVIVDPAKEAQIKNCFNNVRRQVDRHGGIIVYGWAIAISSHIVEAEKHAIWKNPNGELLDITPRIPSIPSLWFVEDKAFKYHGQYIDNVRINATDNVVVDDWIVICEALEDLFSYGKRKNEHEISMPSDIVPLLTHLERLKTDYEYFLANGGHTAALCFCGRQLEYRVCHGPDLQNIHKAIETIKGKYAKNDD